MEKMSKYVKLQSFYILNIISLIDLMDEFI